MGDGRSGQQRAAGAHPPPRRLGLAERCAAAGRRRPWQRPAGRQPPDPSGTYSSPNPRTAAFEALSALEGVLAALAGWLQPGCGACGGCGSEPSASCIHPGAACLVPGKEKNGPPKGREPNKNTHLLRLAQILPCRPALALGELLGAVLAPLYALICKGESRHNSGRSLRRRNGHRTRTNGCDSMLYFHLCFFLFYFFFMQQKLLIFIIYMLRIQLVFNVC